MAAPILPTTAQIVGPGIDAMVAARPSVLAPMNAKGRYYAVPTIIGAQTDVALARVADEVKSARLRFATGTALAQLCASEFNTTLPPEPQAALATVQLARWTGTFPHGVIRKGQIFSKPANPNATPLPVAAATYQAIETTYVPAGQTFATVVCQAVAAGTAGNVPVFTTPLFGTFTGGVGGPVQPPVGSTIPVNVNTDTANVFAVGDFFSVPGAGTYQVANLAGGSGMNVTNTGAAGNVAQGDALPGAGFSIVRSSVAIQPSAPLFDTALQVVYCESSGGSAGLTDPSLVDAARAYAFGQFGPTDGALIAGALSQQSVRHYAFFRAGALNYAQGYVADESWASGAYWTSLIQQAINSYPWLGFGCRLRTGTIVNQLVAVTANVLLKSTEDLANTSDIDANVRAAIRAYFDGADTPNGPGRTDWYSFRLSAIQSVVVAADSRILHCDSVAVTDVLTGATVNEPAATFGQVWQPTLTHFYVGASDDTTDNTITTTYGPPA